VILYIVECNYTENNVAFEDLDAAAEFVRNMRGEWDDKSAEEIKDMGYIVPATVEWRKRPKSSAAVFKPWIVTRPDGGCQVLFPLSELDGLIARVLEAEG